MKIFYFGCRSKSDIGHFLFRNDNGSRYVEYLDEWRVSSIDGFIRPGKQSEATMLRICGWTVMAMGDYSADSRPNSNAAFIAQGKHSFQEMLRMAKEVWPDQFARIESAAPITLLKDCA